MGIVVRMVRIPPGFKQPAPKLSSRGNSWSRPPVGSKLRIRRGSLDRRRQWKLPWGGPTGPRDRREKPNEEAEQRSEPNRPFTPSVEPVCKLKTPFTQPVKPPCQGKVPSRDPWSPLAEKTPLHTICGADLQTENTLHRARKIDVQTATPLHRAYRGDPEMNRPSTGKVYPYCIRKRPFTERVKVTY